MAFPDALQDRILQLLSESKGNILDDEDLLFASCGEQLFMDSLKSYP